MKRKVAALRDPGSYDRPPRHVVAVETHMAWVFLTDDRAFKLKKPVRTRFLDFSTPAARRRDCEREVALNRPLAGSVYRRVAPLTSGPRGELRVGGEGTTAEGTTAEETIIDWLVEMRRLPASESLAARIAERRVRRREVERAIEWLARFYDGAIAEPLTGPDYRWRLAREIRSARDELCAPRYAMPRELVEGIAARRLDELETEGDLFEARARAGRVVDAHGDLRPEHVFLRPVPVIIDCLEFNRELRLLDPISELAFLSLECERMGAGWIGGVASATYRSLSGDAPAGRLARFYRATHALTRAVIALRHLDEPARTDGAQFRGKALAYLELAAGP